MNTPISETARAVVRKLYPELCTGLSDDLVEFVNIAHMVQEALDSAQPVEGETPETDAAISHGYRFTTDNRVREYVPAEDARSLKLRLAEKTARLQKAEELLGEVAGELDQHTEGYPLYSEHEADRIRTFLNQPKP